MLQNGVLRISIFLAVTGIAGANTIYNAVNDFSTAANPNGVWSYRVNNTLMGVLGSSTCTGGSVSGWSNGGSIPNFAGIAVNPNAGSVTCSSTVVIQPNHLNLDPESTGAVEVRFTAPAAGLFSIAGDFRGDDTSEQSHAVSILLNGLPVFSNTISSFNQSDTFNLTEALNAGDTIDFVASSGSSFNNLSTGLAATLTPVSTPEPTSLGFTGLGLCLLGWFSRVRILQRTLAGVQRLAWSILLFSLPFCAALRAGSIVTVYSSGFVLPETISAAPASFGLPAGSLIVADAGDLRSSNHNSTLYVVPPGGGAPTPIGGSLSNASSTFGGIFAPASFGSLSGDYLAFGNMVSNGGQFNAGIYSLNSPGGTLTPFYTDPNVSYALDNPVLAPSGFGSASGDILAPEVFFGGSTSTVIALSPTGSISTFATINNFGSIGGTTGGFGTVFASAGFIPGTDGPVLLVSDGASGVIDWIDSSGNVHLFTTIPLFSGQSGLRSMAFAPAGFGSYGGDLFVSVSGSTQGGGTTGSVDVINSQGQLVGIINQGTVDAPFDPRGLYFAGNSQLLIADSDPSIFSAPPAAVAATTPEPATAPFAVFALGVFAVGVARRRNSRPNR